MTDLRKLLDEATHGRRVQYHPHYCKEAIGAPFADWDSSHDMSVILPDGSRYKIATYRHAGDAALSQVAPQLAAAIIKAEEALAAIAAYTNEPSKDFRQKYPNLSVKIEEALRMAKERGASFMPEVVICDYARAALSEIEKLTGGGE